jgi:hypothetical protein
MPEPLSPAAQAVLDAAMLPCTFRRDIAAAIRALVEQTMPEPDGFNICAPMAPVVMRFDWEIRRLQLAIAAELERINERD